MFMRTVAIQTDRDHCKSSLDLAKTEFIEPWHWSSCRRILESMALMRNKEYEYNEAEG